MSMRGGWLASKKTDLRRLPVLDPRAQSHDQISKVADLFDNMAEDGFERPPPMAECPARTAPDDGLPETLSVPSLDG